ncbi:DUF4352 domain-containing protein [Listeria sp. PSOL-1]|uniref:DUF4352 domain-containing protein n=1 Tax=Listeria sp. PSOL-1 TaxID=1844999 RepID=UPI0013CFE8F5|nr:DUF4352 domain-containing protein [Listeria sp. PSOL-1]
MKKICYIVSLLMLLFGLTACSDNAKPKEQKLTTKKTASWQITPTKVAIQDSDQKNKKRLVVSYKVKNISKKEQGIVAADFFLSDNDEHYFYAEGNLKNINEVLKPGEEKEGKGYYIISDKLKEAELIYSPINSTEKAVWKKVNIPN